LNDKLSCLNVVAFANYFLLCHAGMAFLGGHLYTDVKSEYQVTPSAVVYFRWNHNPVSYIQTNLLRENVPGHPARVVHIDKNTNPQAPFLV
jgi:hypothetical protein